MRSPKIGIGIDIVEVKRFKQKELKTNLEFYNSIFTNSELNYSLRYSNPYPHLAGIFAAKEATIKCFDSPLIMVDIEIIRNAHGKPIAIAKYKKKTVKVNISISHTRSVAIAIAMTIF